MELGLDVIARRIQEEIIARSEQGSVVDGLAERLVQAKHDRSALMALYEECKHLPMRADWPYDEPSDLDGIRRTRPEPVPLPRFYLAEEEVLDKIRGAWLGRVAGCTLGKPLEIGLLQDGIQAYLAGADALPLDNYLPAQSRDQAILRRDCVPAMRGYVRYGMEDDDLNYSCLAVKLLENVGSNFSTLDVGMNWLRSIPFLWQWGPEHAVYLNLATAVGDYTAKEIDLEAVSTYMNPRVENIGAQIRTDVYGYVCPGNPELAAELAWRDAYLSHRKNGIYGAMWVAAMNAAAFTLLDMEAVIRAGLAQVPARSRFAEAILQTIAWARAGGDWRETGQRITEHYGMYGEEGVINNACIVAAALLYAWAGGPSSAAERYEQAITIAVQLGYDTDCNGATAGSVAGLVLGANALPEKWIAPLNDTLRTCVAKMGQVRLSEMAQRTYDLSRIICWRSMYTR